MYIVFDTYEGNYEEVETEEEAREKAQVWLDYQLDEGYEDCRPAQIGWAQIRGQALRMSRREPKDDEPRDVDFIERWLMADLALEYWKVSIDRHGTHFGVGTREQAQAYMEAQCLEHSSSGRIEPSYATACPDWACLGCLLEEEGHTCVGPKAVSS